MLAKLLMKLPAVKRLAEAKDSAVRAAGSAIREMALLRAAKAWPKPAKAMPANEVRRAFAIPMDAPLWQALHQTLDGAIQNAIDDATAEPSATITSERRAFKAGGVDALREFQGRLLELQASANREDTDLQEEKEPT